MIKKVVAAYLLLMAVLVGFHVDITELTEQTLDYVLKRQESAEPPAAGEVTPSTLVISGKTVNLGDSADTVLSVFGEAQDAFLSEYGFLWYSYHKDYYDYVQLGFDADSAVCAMYTNAPTFEFSGLRVGSTIDEARMTLGEPLTQIRKGDTAYLLSSEVDGKRENDVFLFCGAYITVFYDCFKNNTVTALHIIKEETEIAFARRYAEGSPALARAMETENFHVTNALRVREGLQALSFSEQASEVARAHSVEMAENGYFDHTDLSGGSVLDRIKKTGIPISKVAENLAAGAQSGIVMHELLMNSEGHRNNILGPYKYLGVGVAFNGENRPYLTQNYYDRFY